jgi:hypothetical protein
MKKFVKILAIIFALGLVTSSLLAKSIDRNMAISVNPIQLLAGGTAGKFSVGVADRVSIVVPFALAAVYPNPSTNSRIGDISAYTLALSLGVGATYYFSDKAFKNGWYGEADMLVTYIFWSTTSPWLLSPEIRAGYGWVWENGFLINLGLGLAYSFRASGQDPTYTWGYMPGFSPTGELALGYSW